MRRGMAVLFAAGVIAGLAGCGAKEPGMPVPPGDPSALYRMAPGVQSRWSSFENPGAEKGKGGLSNQGAKGHAFEDLKAGETKTLLDVKGSGMVTRMWVTVTNRDPEFLRALRIEMYWDGAKTPAVSAPFGDFFGDILGRTSAFENALFANPEGRSFNCYIPMPFRTGARITVTNDSSRDLPHLFYDVNCILTPRPDPAAMYFHAWWHRERPTTLGRDFEILPAVKGSGRYLGAHIGVVTGPRNIGWWGEGEVKMYLDGDSSAPTIAGTGTEDYIGTGWGLGVFSGKYQGCLTADDKKGLYGFYRYHIPDPVYFQTRCRVTMQQIGGAAKKDFIEAVRKGMKSIPVTIDGGGGDKFTRLLEMSPAKDIADPSLPDGWTNFYREDDWSAVAFFYLDKPENGLPPIAGVGERTVGLEGNEKK